MVIQFSVTIMIEMIISFPMAIQRWQNYQTAILKVQRANYKKNLKSAKGQKSNIAGAKGQEHNVASATGQRSKGCSRM